MKNVIYVLFVLLCSSVFGAQDLNISKNSWLLSSSVYDAKLTNLNLHAGDILWKYDGEWKYYKKSTDGSSYGNMTALKSGEGFWIKSQESYTLHIPQSDKSIAPFRFGWNLVGPGNSDANLTKDETYKDVAYAWIYESGIWKYWIKNGAKQFDTVKAGSGVWIYNVSGDTLKIGDLSTPLKDGIFDKVYKSSNDSVENIWNISFKIEVKDLSNFNIGIKFLKKSSGATGEIVYSGLKLSNGKISPPNALYIKGTKGNGDSGSVYYDDSYDPSGIRANSIKLDGDILTLKLGTIMSKQTITSEETFKAVSDYNITIVPEGIEVVGGETKKLTNLVDLAHVFEGIGVSGDIEIR